MPSEPSQEPEAGPNAEPVPAAAPPEEDDQSCEEEGEEDCGCRECRMGYVPENWFCDDRYEDQDSYDNGWGCDWNESGYFD